MESSYRYKIPGSVSRHVFDLYIPSKNLLVDFRGIDDWSRYPTASDEEVKSLTELWRRLKRDLAQTAGYSFVSINLSLTENLPERKRVPYIMSIINKYKDIVK